MATKRSAGVTPDLVIHCMQVMKHTNERFNLALKPRTDVVEFQGCSVA